MRDAPIWELLRDCAQELTSAGRSPFTREDLIACVQRADRSIATGSINPIIQGITDNLKGGAPGAVGKNILHRVAKGQFVLRAGPPPGPRPTEETLSSQPDADIISPNAPPSLPRSEGELRDALIRLLRPVLGGVELEAEGPVLYRLPSGRSMSHASDILAFRRDSSRRVSIEIKYRSAVTDQFKARAFDAAHMKREHGSEILTMLLFAKSTTGISIDRARDICHQFDRFHGKPAHAFLELGGLDEVAVDIRHFLLKDDG